MKLTIKLSYLIGICCIVFFFANALYLLGNIDNLVGIWPMIYAFVTLLVLLVGLTILFYGIDISIEEDDRKKKMKLLEENKKYYNKMQKI